LTLEGGHGWLLPASSAVFVAGHDVVALVHGSGLRLGTWIVDEPQDAARLTTWGLDAVATNDPRTIVPAVRTARRS
jgi:glycerophosphoryl diester phosphodiesterase